MCLGQVEAADVAGQREHRDAPLGERRVDRLLEQRRHLVDAGDRPVEARDVGEQRVVVDLLEEVAAHLLARAPGRRSRAPGRGDLLGVVQPVEQVDRARADRAHADAEVDR